MAWYRTGTISVTNSSATVTGSGTSWVANVSAGEAIYLPDGKFYEIQSVDSTTQITLVSAYTGTTLSGQTYKVMPTQSFIHDLANQASDLLNTYSTIASAAGAGKFGDGTVSAPGISFSSDTNSGIYRVSDGVYSLVSNGTAVATINGTTFQTSGNTVLGDASGDTTTISGALTQSASLGGSTNTLTVKNTSNTASSTARVLVQTGGTSAGDAYTGYYDGTSLVTVGTKAGDSTLYFGSNGPSGTVRATLTSGKVFIAGGGTTATSNGGSLETSNGITFPAAWVGCANANTLDDYEEGTWTPSMKDGSGNAATLTSSTGYYTKIGNLVTASGTLVVQRGALTVTNLTLQGLPFTSKNVTATPALNVGYFTGLNSNVVMLAGYLGANATYAYFQKLSAAGAGMSALTYTDIPTASDATFYFTISYLAAN